MSRLYSTYIKYGVSAENAKLLEHSNIPLTTFRATSKSLLIEKYGFDETLIDTIKEAIQRQPIDNETIDTLLERNNFTCCTCKGQKGKSYIIHHIEEYSKSQNNSYNNLAVLCPVCHDMAHTRGGLTNSITPEQVSKAKSKWETMVEKNNMETASKNGEISDIDFINIPRITELALELLQTIPETTISERLIRENIISADRELNIEELKKRSNGQYYFDFILSAKVRHHFFEIFQYLLHRLDFKNLDDLLNLTSLKSLDIIGTYCFYVGGLYGKRPDTPINDESPTTHLYFKRRRVFVEWIIDPRFITSSSAISRFGTRTTYLVYGKIRDVRETKIDGKTYLHIDIRAYVAGIPTKTVNRAPKVCWDNYITDDFELETDEE